jgi:hypothetical protein
MENVRAQQTQMQPRRLLWRKPYQSRLRKQSIPYTMSVSWSIVGNGKGFNDPVSEKDKIIFIFGKTGVFTEDMRTIKRKRNEDLIVHQLEVTPYWKVSNGKIRIGVLVCSTPKGTAKRYVMLYLQEEDIPKEYMSGKYDEISIKTLRNKFIALAEKVNAPVPVETVVNALEDMNMLHLKL